MILDGWHSEETGVLQASKENGFLWRARDNNLCARDAQIASGEFPIEDASLFQWRGDARVEQSARCAAGLVAAGTVPVQVGTDSRFCWLQRTLPHRSPWQGLQCFRR